MAATEEQVVDTSHFREEAGEPVGDMPREPPPGPLGDAGGPVEDLRVDGTTQLGMFDAGGKQPSSATVTLSGGKFELMEGRAFQKGDVIHFEGTAIVREVKVRDKADPKTGVVVSASQGHTAQITDLQVHGAG